jgi:hypothetical protein
LPHVSEANDSQSKILHEVTLESNTC